MEMFNKKSQSERIGDELKKSSSLDPLKEVERYFLKKMRQYKTEASYDVIANETPYFRTINYTEYANCFIIHPLCQDLRVQQMRDAYNVNTTNTLDYIKYFKSNILENKSNKYKDREDLDLEAKSALVVLVGSNKLKDRVCLNKLSWIKDNYDDDVYFKPHPLTYHTLIGELKDIFGEDKILPREANMYSLMLKSDIVYTSHMSESAIYATALNKEINPIDVYNKVEQGSFYHINKFLFIENDPQTWVNRTFSSYKSGIINPVLNKDWKSSIDNYLEYIHEVRDMYKDFYIEELKKDKK